MRIEPRTVGSIAHVIKRGARGMPIVRDASDRIRFTKSLYFLNDSFSDENWTTNLKSRALFERPDHWPEQEPLVHILAWTLMPNHFHLLLKEIRDGGIAKFMQRLCGSMSAAFNAKYSESGSIFQGSYKSRTVDGDTYLRYLAFYIQVKNVLELYPGGLTKASRNFDDAWGWALHYPFSSLGAYATNIHSPIIHTTVLTELFPDAQSFKTEARDMLALNLQRHTDEYSNLLLEPW